MVPHSPQPGRRSPTRKRSQHPPLSPPIPPKQIISLLNLLDRMDDDITRDVQRLRESIKETHLEIAEAHKEIQQEERQLARHRAKEQRETKGIDDDFWLNA